MSYVEYACEGRLLFRAEAREGAVVVPRVNEVVMIDDEPYQVVDIEYWARRVGASDRRTVSPTVYLMPIDPESWQRRLARRQPREGGDAPPLRY
jgi:hypothetical protein